jgi:PAS domain S-box-containing protein
MAKRSQQGSAGDSRRRTERGGSSVARVELHQEAQVYQEELAVQNEKLRRAQLALEETRDRFVELYDFAPNGYLTLDRQGVVLQINLTGAAMLARPRHTVEGVPFLGFVDVSDRSRLLDFLRRCRAYQGSGDIMTELRINASDDVRYVQLLCRPGIRHRGHEEPGLFTAMLDITARKQLESEREKLAEERAALTSRVISIQEQERLRIARDLHDNIGQYVTALRLKLELIAIRLLPASPAREAVESAQRTVEQLDQQVDYIATELRPVALDLGIEAALRRFVSEWSAMFNIPAEFHSSGVESTHLISEIETQVYRVGQEALNNACKHASPTHVGVILERKDHHLVLIVEDNGTGFDGEEARDERRGLGLVGMRERAQIIGGALEIESAPGRGTTVFLRVPYAFRTV